MMIARGGLPWIVCVGILSIVLCATTLVLWFHPLKIFPLILSVFSLCFLCLLLVFFRDPQREIGEGIVAAADGRIRAITDEHDENLGDCTRISTFMNLHNVHVNRMPLDGRIKNMTHHPGSHLPAFQKESEKNERVILLIETSQGSLKVIQIAGTLARRIVPYVKQGDSLKKGEKLGLIRLGSRVDVLVQRNMIKHVLVTVGQHVKAGEDSLAQLHD